MIRRISLPQKIHIINSLIVASTIARLPEQRKLLTIVAKTAANVRRIMQNVLIAPSAKKVNVQNAVKTVFALQAKTAAKKHDLNDTILMERSPDRSIFYFYTWN